MKSVNNNDTNNKIILLIIKVAILRVTITEIIRNKICLLSTVIAADNVSFF